MVLTKNEFQLDREFVQKLLEENIRLRLENERLASSLKELKSLERWWKGSESGNEGGCLVVFSGTGSGEYKN